tara:strand:- start:198 stop:560 length:363 start_codon:yes stop_codon:yes gene_type:complete
MKKLILFLIVISFFKAGASEERVKQNEIFKNIRCLVCQGQSIGDSNSEFAQVIKLVVIEQIKEGKTKEEIYSFLTSKYGEWIIYQPPFNNSSFLLWMLPYFVLVLGGLIIFNIIKKGKHK